MHTGSEGELSFLNRHHSFPLESWSESTTAVSFLGHVRKWLKVRIRKVLFGSLMADYLKSEQEYQANLVRLLNSWKLENEQNLHGLRHALAVANERLNTSESVVRGLERIIAAAGRTAAAKNTSSEPEVSFEKDYSYLLLENRFRGSEEEIERRLASYVPVLQGAPGPVLEIGSGRGELLNLLKTAKIPAYGVELDPAMVERCQARGLDARLENGLAHLESAPNESFGAVIAIQVLEHLPYSVLQNFLALARTRVKKGGLVIAETIDTSSMIALSQNYFRDPTHEAPLHPETLRYLFELAGLEVLDVRKLSAFPPGFELENLPETGEGDSAASAKAFNRNIAKLNSLLYGHQDYCIIARA